MKTETETETKAMGRREALAALGAAGAAFALGCGADAGTSPSETTGAGGTTSTNGTCAVAPNETAGPYPSRQDIFRTDIREDRPGTVLLLLVRVVNASSGCAAVAGANVEIWQCDAVGNYSEYGTQTAATYLRGLQTTNANGEVVFTTVYPGWYQGRATHIHAEVTVNGVSRKVTQIAFPESVNDVVHRSGVYASRGTNPTSNASDGIFADSLSAELVTPTGDPASGYAVSFQIGI